eukprot:3211846-Rhodomonas_salina.5
MEWGRRDGDGAGGQEEVGEDELGSGVRERKGRGGLSVTLSVFAVLDAVTTTTAADEVGMILLFPSLPRSITPLQVFLPHPLPPSSYLAM